MVSVQVRLEGPTESVVRETAAQLGVQVSTVRGRQDSWHLYGSLMVATTTSSRKFREQDRDWTKPLGEILRQ